MARLPSIAIPAIILIALFASPAKGAVADGALYVAEDLSLWRAVAAVTVVEDRSLALRGASFAALEAPGGLSLPADASMVSIEAANKGDASCVMSLFAAGGVRVRDVRIKGGGDAAAFREHHIYLREAQRGFSGPVITFQCADIDVRVKSVRFSRPAPLKMLRIFWGAFWDDNEITAFTINSVAAPKAGPFSFPALLYALMAASAVISYALQRISRGGAAGESASRAALAAFILAGVVFAVRMDYGRLVVLMDEAASFSGADTLQRVRAVNNGYLDRLLDFTQWVRRTVPPGATVGPAAVAKDGRFAALARYYLLPVRTSHRADYLWVFGDEGVEFSPSDNSLKAGDKTVASRVAPFAAERDGFALYERIR